MVLSPQCFHNIDAHADIFNHGNVQFWEYAQVGYDAIGFISCTGAPCKGNRGFGCACIAGIHCSACVRSSLVHTFLSNRAARLFQQCGAGLWHCMP